MNTQVRHCLLSPERWKYLLLCFQASSSVPLSVLGHFFKHLKQTQDFPGGPVAKTQCPHCRGPGSIPGQETTPATKSFRVATNDPICHN